MTIIASLGPCRSVAATGFKSRAFAKKSYFTASAGFD